MLPALQLNKTARWSAHHAFRFQLQVNRLTAFTLRMPLYVLRTGE